MKEVFAEHAMATTDGAVTGPSQGCGSSTSAPASRRRSAPACSASWAPRSSRSSSPVAATSCGPSGRSSDGLLAVLGGRGPGPQERHPRPAPARGPGRSSAGWRPRPTWSARTSGPGTMEGWDIGPGRLRRRGWCGPASASSARTARTPHRPGLDRLGIAYGGLLHLTGYPDRPPVRPGVTISDYLTGVFAAEAAVGRPLPPRPRRRWHRAGRGDRRPAVRLGAAHPRVDARRLRPARHGPRAGGQPPAQLGPARQLPHRRRQATCASSPAPTPTSAGCAGPWTGPTWPTTPVRHPGRPGAGARRDQRHRGRRGPPARPPPRSRRPASPHDVPVGTAYSAADIFADPHMAARGDLVDGRRPGGRAPSASRPRSPPRRAPARRRRGPPPGSGEHNDEVWCGLVGLSAEELAGYRDRGII